MDEAENESAAKADALQTGRSIIPKRPAWFGFIDDFLKKDAEPNAPRTFRTAVFDPKTGAILNFRRRVSGTHERQEITIRVMPPAPLKPGDESTK